MTAAIIAPTPESRGRGVSPVANRLRETLPALSDNGVKIDVDTSDLGMATAAAQLHRKGLDARFVDTTVTVAGKRAAAEDLKKFQTLQLRETDLRQLSAVVHGQHDELTPAEKDGLNSVQTLIARGARFQIAMSKTSYDDYDADSIPVNVAIPVHRTVGQGLVLLSSAHQSLGTLQCEIDHVTYPVRSLESLVRLPETGSKSAVQNFGDTVKLLSDHGIGVALKSNEDGMSNATRVLESGRHITVQFNNATVTTSTGGKSARISDADVHSLCTRNVNDADLKKIAAVLYGDTKDLSPNEASAFQSLDTLTQQGATFQISRPRHQKSTLGALFGSPTSEHIDVMTLPNDRAGCARVLLHLCNMDYQHRLTVTVNGVGSPIDSFEHLSAISCHNSRARRLGENLAVLRENNIETGIPDNEIAVSALAQRMDPARIRGNDRRLKIQFKSLPTEGIPPEDAAALQSTSLSLEQLDKIAGILSGREGALNEQETRDMGAFDKLSSYGANFTLSRNRTEVRTFGLTREVTDTVAVPSGKLGQAVIYAHLTAAQPGNRESRLSMNNAGTSLAQSLENFQQATDIADQLL